MKANYDLKKKKNHTYTCLLRDGRVWDRISIEVVMEEKTD